MTPHTALAAEYARQREALLREYPDIDAETLADTLEGITYLPDILARLIRDAREDKAMADALGTMMAESKERQDRLTRRAAKRREVVLALMQAAGMKKLEQPDFTASIRNGAAKVVLTDEDAIPIEFHRATVTIDKTKIKDALQAGKEVAGAVLSNGEASITARFR